MFRFYSSTFLLLLAGCATAPVVSSDGYGERPVDPIATIAGMISSPHVRLLRDPDPFYVRDSAGWHYGWRVCAETDEGDEGFFLLRGDQIIYAAKTRDRADRAAAQEVSQNCPRVAEG